MKMKSKLFILTCLLTLTAGLAQAQWVVTDPTSRFQSILNSLNEIDQAAKSTEQIYNNFQQTKKIYDQSKAYYDKLRGVTDLVRDARRVQQCILIVSDISDMYMTNYDRMLTDQYLTTAELQAIARGYTALLREGTDTLRDLQDIINPTSLSMTDKERLDIIERTYRELMRLRRLTTVFTRVNINAAILRAQQNNDLERSLSLYGSDEDKYW